MISPTLTSPLSQRRQFDLNCKKNIALKFAWKIVALFTENYPSVTRLVQDPLAVTRLENRLCMFDNLRINYIETKLKTF